MEFLPSDLTEPETLKKVVEDVNLIFHTASLVNYSSVSSREKSEKVNVQGVRNHCEAVLDSDLESFVHWSSLAVYGKPKHDLLPMKEDHPKNPKSNYDKSKWLQEKEIMKYHGLPHAFLCGLEVCTPLRALLGAEPLHRVYSRYRPQLLRFTEEFHSPLRNVY